MNAQRNDIGMIGLGTMGSNLVLNIADNGFAVAVFNRTTSVTEKFASELAARPAGAALLFAGGVAGAPSSRPAG